MSKIAKLLEDPTLLAAARKVLDSSTASPIAREKAKTVLRLIEKVSKASGRPR